MSCEKNSVVWGVGADEMAEARDKLTQLSSRQLHARDRTHSELPVLKGETLPFAAQTRLHSDPKVWLCRRTLLQAAGSGRTRSC
jgi:hypothetical protein